MIATNPVLTTKGQSLLIRAISGELITFTRFKMGDGELGSQDADRLNDLVHPCLSVEIVELDKSTAGSVGVTGEFDSGDVTQDFIWRELGIFAKGADGEEVLYAYANDGQNASMLRAVNAGIAIEQRITMVVAIGQAANVTAVYNQHNPYKRIIVSNTKPEGHDLLWFQPSATMETKYAKTTSENRDSTLIFSGANSYKSVHSLTAANNDTLSDGAYTYTLDYVLYMIPGSSSFESNLTMDITLTKGNKTVTFAQTKVPRIAEWQAMALQATVESSVNLCDDTEPITVTFHLGNYDYYNIYLQSNTQIKLTCVNKNASADVMTGTLSYLP